MILMLHPSYYGKGHEHVYMTLLSFCICYPSV